MSNKLQFRDYLERRGVIWESAPNFEKIKEIKERVIIGPNGCGKSRLLRALSETLSANQIGKTDVIYADFPEMASIERKGVGDTELALLENIFTDRRNTPIYNTLKLISSDPVKGVTNLIALSKTDRICKSAVDKVNLFLEPMCGGTLKLSNFVENLGDDRSLSPGQRSMFYMSIMLGVLAAHRADDEFYILLDEPDQHLHAKSIVDFVKLLQKHLPKAKLWIATHSVHLMAHFKFSDIIYIKSDKVQSNNSMMYDEICKTMVDTEGMQQFISFSGLYGFYEFFRECFSEPDAESDADGKKLSQLKQRVMELNIKKILDYGAGKGRFFKLLADIPNIEYHAFEYFSAYHEDLNDMIRPTGIVYGNEADIPDGEFDAVLLINTLHEIPITEWATTFYTIKRALKDGGHLFFCETAPLITGEKVENTGFLVLSIKEQSELFGVTSEHLDQKQKLHFSQVAKSHIPVLVEEKLKTTLEILKENSFTNWESEDKNARNAAFYAVQNLNAQKVLNQLSDIARDADNLAQKQKAVSLDHENASCWNDLGVALYDMKHCSKALSATRRAVELEPYNTVYLNNLSYMLYEMGHYDEDLEIAQRVVKLEPENAKHQHNLGISLYNMKRYDEALEANQRAVELAPKNASYQDSLGDTLYMMKRYDEALEANQRAVLLAPKDASYQYSLGDTLYMMKRYDEALEANQRAVMLEPKNVSYQGRLGDILYMMKRYDEALEANQRAIELAPKNASYQGHLGDILHMMKRYDEALEANQRAVTLEPENANYHFNLGVTLHAMKRYDEAFAAKQRAVELMPDNTRYQKSLAVTLRAMERYDL